MFLNVQNSRVTILFVVTGNIFHLLISSSERACDTAEFHTINISLMFDYIRAIIPLIKLKIEMFSNYFS